MKEKTQNIYNLIHTMSGKSLLTIIESLDKDTQQDFANYFKCELYPRAIAGEIERSYKREKAVA